MAEALLEFTDHRMNPNRDFNHDTKRKQGKDTN